MGRKRSQLEDKKPKNAGGRAKRRQQDPRTFKTQLELKALNKSKF